MDIDILQVQNLTVSYKVGDLTAKGINNVSLNIRKGSITALIGESGSGKTTLLSAILGFLPKNAKVNGKVVLNGEKIMENGKFTRKFRLNRWRLISYIPQNAMSVLAPTRKIKAHFIDTAEAYNIPKDRALKEASNILNQVGLNERVLDLYPFELSGGMKQRVIIALAVFLKPLVTIADEPTSAVDMLTQKKILDLIKDINQKFGITFLISTHDVSVASYISDQIYVIYNGFIVEHGSKKDIISHPLHPYTIYLLSNVISLSDGNKLSKFRTYFKPKEVSSNGCPFAVKCPFVTHDCFTSLPNQIKVDDREVMCNRYLEVEKIVYS
ncbi:ABC transporter ATP-binding protein [Sulfolobus sp. SCGC AB-777_L09]|nr:ABC transporter ATP-binding protein [Sulfolobus sp. SCGC AB-777_L09]